jgi:ribonuclease P protein component
VLTKKNRFQGPAGLTRVYQKGVTVRSQFCAARFTRGKRAEFRVAVVVSKKVAKSAPERNRIRRRIYEIVRLQSPHYLTNEDVVITIFDSRLSSIEHEELQEIIIRLLSQIKEN